MKISFARAWTNWAIASIAAKQTYLQQRDYDDRLFGERFVPEG